MWFDLQGQIDKMLRIRSNRTMRMEAGAFVVCPGRNKICQWLAAKCFATAWWANGMRTRWNPGKFQCKAPI